ncbi:hypothetical protein [Leclercia adecarboxylata]|uniref:hypothetical protein n=1 Tax=Leclercia adecarboxylata TaxID=83655 RepID=UPI0021F17C71|nr:hypothetical protein [Leclercia adecarboxylata]UYM57777.1 hypothetical protein N5937_11120 [Leclercia adecarboxylata]
MKKIITFLAVSVAIAAPAAHAINAHYRDQLIRSGCTQMTEAQGCDIYKTKAQNEAAGFSSGIAPTVESDVKKFDGDYVARRPNGQRITNIRIGAGKVKLAGKPVKATVANDMLIINGSNNRTFVIYTTGGSFWENTETHDRGIIERG